MPTPVSSFSPFTPFTPASSTQNSGGYFDRPTAGNMGISSPLARRPDMRNSGVGSSSFLRMSRMAGASDSLRQSSENGWRMASRMREEAWSAWEQHLGKLSFSTIKNVNLSPRPSKKVNLIHNKHEGIESDKSLATVTEGMKISSSPRAPEFIIPGMVAGPYRSISSNGLARPPKLEVKRRSFDPSFFPRLNEIKHDSAN